jgi:hypothetical protein
MFGLKFLRPTVLKNGRVKLAYIVASVNTETKAIRLEAIHIDPTQPLDLYKNAFDLFLITNKRAFSKINTNKLTVIFNIKDETRYVKYLSLRERGFHLDLKETRKAVKFTKPWREQEEINIAAYSRSLVT